MSTKRQPDLPSPWRDEASSLARLYELTGKLLRAADLNSGLKEALDAAIEVLGADRGNVQILNADKQVLEIVVQEGFRQEFLDFFREVRAEEEAACGHALRTGERFVIEDIEKAGFGASYRKIAAAAGYRSVQSTPLVGRDGALLGILSTHWSEPHKPSDEQFRWLDMYIRQASDLIERMRAEVALAESAERERQLVAETIEATAKYRAVFDQAAVFAGIMALDGTLIEANRLSLDACGYKLEEVIGRVFWETPWWAGNEEVQDKIRAATLQAASGAPYEAELPYVWKDGSRHVVNFALHPIRDESGKIIYLHPTGVDITDRKNSERQAQELHGRLEQQTRVFNATLSAISDFVYVFDRHGRFVYINQPLLDLWGLKLEDALGKNFFDLKYPDDLAIRLQRQIQQVFDTRQTVRDETAYTSPTGVVGYYDYIFCPVFDAQGNVEVVAGTTRDITERKCTENALRESEQRLRTLAESLESQVRARTAELEQRSFDVLKQSEELRDLSARLMHIQDQERRHMARELHDSAGQTLAVLGMHLATLTRQVRRYVPQSAKIALESEDLLQQLNQEIRTTSYLLHPPLLDEAGLGSAIRGYVRGLAERGALDVTVDVPEDFGRLPGTLELMLFRIVQESLTNVIRHSESKVAAIHVARHGETIHLEISDSGKGIPAERLADIRASGSGVGILGMRERVRQFKGEMRIDSTPAGTRISISLPVPAQT
jgi:PAS domain S-box-containing protein